MTKNELKFRLQHIRDEQKHGGYMDCETDHQLADELLLLFINDKEVTDLFCSIHKWYK